MNDFNKHTMGRIHSFESFGTVDGPGIRFVVFMQGCNLQCKFCHNRDTWDSSGGKVVTVEDLVTRILKYKNYFISSHGGVTISGGEPLLQTSFLLTLCTQLKKHSIHIALDTSGMVTITDEIATLISLVDLFLLDIKHIDDEKCKELVGVSNNKELTFARYLSEHHKPIWIRQVLIPGITDKEEDLLKLKSFISSLKTVEKVELLPYHTLGKFKWEKLGFPYSLESITSPSEEQLLKAKRLLGIL